MDCSGRGAGTWAWGNQFLWGYDTAMDPELQEIFDLAISSGVNLFDTADSYGTGALNGRSEELLGRFVRENEDIQAGSPVHIATKLAGYPWRVTPWNMTAACRCATAVPTPALHACVCVCSPPPTGATCGHSGVWISRQGRGDAPQRPRHIGMHAPDPHRLERC